MFPDNFHQLQLKTRFRLLLLQAMSTLKKRPCDIEKGTEHHWSYVSGFLKEDTNHSMDVAEGIANAINCRIEIAIVPIDCPPVAITDLMNFLTGAKILSNGAENLNKGPEKFNNGVENV